MVDAGGVFRRVLGWVSVRFARRNDASTGALRRFSSTEHLSSEAVAAYVDGELRMSAHLRAAHHLSLCPECVAEVGHQERARAALRDSSPIRVPHRLLGLLSQIPDSSAAAPKGDRPGESADGEQRDSPGRR